MRPSVSLVGFEPHLPWRGAENSNPSACAPTRVRSGARSPDGFTPQKADLPPGVNERETAEDGVIETHPAPCRFTFHDQIVRRPGVEPGRPKTHAPEACAAASYATSSLTPVVGESDRPDSNRSCRHGKPACCPLTLRSQGICPAGPRGFEPRSTHPGCVVLPVGRKAIAYAARDLNPEP
jgi:hypothetical protein